MYKQIISLSLTLVVLQTVHGQQNEGKLAGSTSFYKDVTKTHLPYQDLQLLSMDAGIADLDQDGDMDILIANEHRPNILLINDGKGRFTNESALRIPQVDHDSEDIGIADFNLDGDLDIIQIKVGMTVKILALPTLIWMVT